MSKRFGRNQRRRARESIAALEKKVDVQKRIIDADRANAMAMSRAYIESRMQITALTSTLQHCVETLRHGTLALPPPQRRVEEFAKDERSLPDVLRAPPMARAPEVLDLASMTAEATEAFVMHELSVFTEATDYDRLANRVHYRITNRRGFDVAYAIDRAAILNKAEAKIIQHHIAPAFARLLIDGERR